MLGKFNQLTKQPAEGRRVICLYESTHSGLQEVYTANYRQGRFIDGGLLLQSIIGWLPAPEKPPG